MTHLFLRAGLPLYALLFLLCVRCTTVDEASPYFNTSFLIHYDQVKTSLIKDGFQEIYFPSEDNILLNGLLLDRADASCNVLLCSGFYPGRKEGLAAFLHLLPETCNICMFDARGHGCSKGSFLSNIVYYGTDEYKDIIGALKYIRTRNNKPIFILGMCAGAFHTVKAVHQIQTNGLHHLMPAGIILDSSILSIPQAYDVPRKYFIQNILPNILRKTICSNQSKKTIKEGWLYTLCRHFATPFLIAFECALYPCIFLRKDPLDIRSLCREIETPICFIHAQNDIFAPLDMIQECCKEAYACWLPAKAEHACIYLQHKIEYRIFLHTYITNMLTIHSLSRDICSHV